MKKLLSGILVLVMLVISMASCDKQTDGETTSLGDSSKAETNSSESSSRAESKYIVTYAGGDGATGEGPASKEVIAGDRLPLPGNTFTKDGYTFTGWTDGEKSYLAGTFFTPSKDTTLTAEWEKQKNEIILSNCDSIAPENLWFGFPVLALGTSQTPKEGTGYWEQTQQVDVVWMNSSLDLDITKYKENNGSIYLWLYVDKPENVTGGQLEFSSSGVPDSKELGFNITKNLKSGWNEITIPFSSGVIAGGEPDYSKINYCRVYVNIDKKQTTVGLDDIKIILPDQ